MPRGGLLSAKRKTAGGERNAEVHAKKKGRDIIPGKRDRTLRVIYGGKTDEHLPSLHLKLGKRSRPRGSRKKQRESRLSRGRKVEKGGNRKEK